jgi:NAD(P)-dependent dehydrogenase (short-subunit alcohol dehydrogenase family)
MNDHRLDGRTVVVTGAGRGLGAGYARLMAEHGASLVLNDLGGASDGTGSDTLPVAELAGELRDLGAKVEINTADVSDPAGARSLVDQAVETFGSLDVLVNNAGILRDRMLVNMSVEEWDAVVRVHLRGHFCTARAAAEHWRGRGKAQGGPIDAVLINTSSTSGLLGSMGQTNYAAAKAGIAAFTQICHLELNERYGVRVYAIAPGARTRLTMTSPGAQDAVAPPEEPSVFDFWDPANVAPLVAWLSAPGCPAPSGAVFLAQGDEVGLFRPWEIQAMARNGGRWSFEGLDVAVPSLFAQAAASHFPAGAQSVVEAAGRG